MRRSAVRLAASYTGVDPTGSEIERIRRCGEGGIADVLAARWKVSWNGSCRQEGDHTSILVPVWAWGPGSTDFAGSGSENELVGRTLLGYFG
jgi:hypothetical protein